MKAAFEKYLKSYLDICPKLTETELGFIRNNLSIRELSKGDLFLKKGSIQKDMGFVFKGLLISYYIDEKGKKITIGFINEDKYASDYPSFIKQKPSKYFVEALEPSIMVNLPFKAIQEAYGHHKGFENYGRLIAEEILIQKQERLESFLFMNAQERYLNFIHENSKIINRISVSDLSSYLGIERQSLTRIRKNLMKNQFDTNVSVKK